MMSGLKTTSQDANDGNNVILSSAMVLISQVNSNDNNIQPKQQQQQQQQKKKKCHGNRKEQHKRRRQRHRQQKLQTYNQNTNQLYEDMNDASNEQQLQISTTNDQQQSRAEHKRKRQECNNHDVNVSRSFSQMSISGGNNRKKMKQSTRTGDPSNNDLLHVVNDEQQEEANNNMNNNNNNNIHKFKPHYLQVSDRIFQKILLNAVPDANELVHYLNTKEKLHFIRQMTEITHHFHYLSLQHELWQGYDELGLKEDDLWTARVSKSFAKQHCTCRRYGFSKQLITKRQQAIRYQLQRTSDQLQQYTTQLQHNSKEWQPSFDPNRLLHVINECVKHNQQRLRQECEYRRKTLAFDSNDHRLIKKFYQLQPNQEQIDLAKKIWQTTADELQMKEYEETLRKRIYLQRLPSEFDTTINRSTNSLETLLANPVLNNDRRACLISSCSKTVTQYKFDLMTINLNTVQTIKREHQVLLVDLQTKLLQTNWIDPVKQAIEHRQQAMIERHDFYLKHKLSSFFDEAPTANQH